MYTWIAVEKIDQPETVYSEQTQQQPPGTVTGSQGTEQSPHDGNADEGIAAQRDQQILQSLQHGQGAPGCFRVAAIGHPLQRLPVTGGEMIPARPAQPDHNQDQQQQTGGTPASSPQPIEQQGQYNHPRFQAKQGSQHQQ